MQRIQTPHGLCVLVEVDDHAPLHPDEQSHASTLAELRRREFIGGRSALHHAIADWSMPILSNDRGAPIMPDGWLGSVSHKGTLAGALVAPTSIGGHVGLDLERAAPPKQDIGRRILTPREQAQIRDGRDVTLRFAIKEAIYKAIDPYVRRYVGFTEVELEIGDQITVVTEIPLAIEATWREHEGFWLATARALPR